MDRSMAIFSPIKFIRIRIKKKFWKKNKTQTNFLNL